MDVVKKGTIPNSRGNSRTFISDMIFPIGDVKLTEDDFIPLRRGGTGFASANQELKAKLYRPAMQC